MYYEFLKALVAYINSLDETAQEIDVKEIVRMASCLNYVPVIQDDALCGFLVDEIGSAYMYVEATKEQQDWWSQRPPIVP